MVRRVPWFPRDVKRGKLGEEVTYWLLVEWYGAEHVQDKRDEQEYRDRDIDFVVEYTWETKSDFRSEETDNVYLETIALHKSDADYWMLCIPHLGWVIQVERGEVKRLHDDPQYLYRRHPTPGRVVPLTAFVDGINCRIHTDCWPQALGWVHVAVGLWERAEEYTWEQAA